MKHCIIVKFKPDVSEAEWKPLLPEIEALFNHTLEIDGIDKVNIYTNCTARDNRYDLMIEMDMEPAALPEYDECEWHLKWKADYGHLIEKKAIFDYEVENITRNSPQSIHNYRRTR